MRKANFVVADEAMASWREGVLRAPKTMSCWHGIRRFLPCHFAREDCVMAKPLLSDALWQRVEPLLPTPKPRRFRYPGRKPLDYRKVLTGIIFVLKTGLAWEDLPCEMGCGSGMSCLNYLKAWHQAGVWARLHQLLLQELEDADKIDWSRGAVDATMARALGGGEDTGRNPTDRGKLGSKHHVLTDAGGCP
jgi:transposase